MSGEEQIQPQPHLGDTFAPYLARLAKKQGLAEPMLFPGRASRGSGDLRTFILVLLKHWKAAAIFAVATLAVVATATFLMTAIYEPEGRIQIDPPGEETFSLQSSNGTPDTEYISTEAEKLETAELARGTIQALGLSHNPELAGKAALHVNEAQDAAEHAALVQFQANLSVRRDPGSRLVGVRFASHDPRLSAMVVNKLMKLFIDNSYQSRHEAIQQSSLWLARQLDDIREKTATSSRAVVDFQRQHGIADTGHDSTTLSQQVGELNKQLADAESQRIQLESYTRHSPGFLLPQISSNPVIQQLTQRRAELYGQMARAQVLYGPNHPEVRKLQKELEELDRQLGLQRSVMQTELQSSYQAARRREALLEREVQNSTAQLSEMEQYLNLKKQAEADRQLYDNLYAKIKESGIAAASKSSNMRIVEEAAVLDRPTRPHRRLNLLLGLVFGVFGGLALAFVKEGLEDRIHTTDDVRSFTGLSSIVVVPAVRENTAKLSALKPSPPAMNREQQPPLLLNQPRSPQLEAVNALRTVVMLSRENRQQVLMITSPLSGDGKTTVATSLAVSLAKLGRTCLIDADLRRPRIAKALCLSPGPGFAELLRGQVSLHDVLRPFPHVPALSVIASGEASEEPVELLSSFSMSRTIQDLRGICEYVVLDTPPVLPFAEGRALATIVDGIILVGRAASTPRIAMTRTMELFQELRSAPILTVVLNGVDFRASQYKYYAQY
jgi:polysaccharide biosynthesis transport protein